MKTRALTLPAIASLLLLAPAALAESPSADVADATSSDSSTYVDGGWADVGPDPDGITYTDAWDPDGGPYPGECAADTDCGDGQYCGIDGWCWDQGDGPCTTDADCGEGNACLYGWCEPAEPCTSDADCWTEFCGESGFCATPPSCAQDSDCPDGDICDWGYCAPKGSRCLSDAECPDMSYCDPDYWGMSGGGTTGSGGSGGGAVPAYDAGPSADASYDDVPPEPWTEWGACVVDPTLVTVTSDCATLCAAIMPCITEGGDPPPPAQDAGSAPGAGAADPGAQEQCEVTCSYGQTTEAVSADALHALLTCVTDNPACEDMFTACSDQVQAVGSAMESLPVEFGYGEDPVVVEEDPYAEGPWDDVGPGPSSDTAIGEPMDYMDTTAPAQDVATGADVGAADAGSTDTSSADTGSTDTGSGAGADAGAADAGTSADGVATADAGTTTTPPSAKTDSGGCNAGGTTPAFPAGLTLLLMLGLAALRRRLS